MQIIGNKEMCIIWWVPRDFIKGIIRKVHESNTFLLKKIISLIVSKMVEHCIL